MKRKHLSILVFNIIMLIGLRVNAVDYYWVNNEGFWWDYANHWATASGGTIMHASPPTSADNVYFDINSFTLPNQKVKFDSDPAYCNDMDWTGAGGTPQLIGPQPLYIYGFLKFIPDMIVDYGAPTYFKAAFKTVTITTAGHAIPVAAYFDGQEGHWELQDDFDVSGSMFVNWGHLKTNSFAVSCYRFGSNPLNLSNVRSLDLGSSLLTIELADDNINSIYSCNINNDMGTLTITSSGTSLFHFLGLLGSLSTMYAGINLTYDDVLFDNDGKQVANLDNFHDVTFLGNGTLVDSLQGFSNYHNVTVHKNGTFYVNNCTFNIAEIYWLGLDYSNSSTYNRLLFSTHPNGCWCCDPRNIDYGLLKGNNNLINDLVEFNRNGTINGNNNVADSCYFHANGYLLTGSNEFNDVLLQRYWNISCTCSNNYVMDSLTMEKNQTQTIHNALTLIGEIHCLHTLITTTQLSTQATVLSDNPLKLFYVELKGIHGQNGLLVMDTAVQSIDYANNINWYFGNSYIPLEDSSVIVTPVSPCSYSTNGTVAMWGKGGEKPYSYYRWIPGGWCGGYWTSPNPTDTNVFINLPQGNYTFKIVDFYGCENVLINVTVGGPAPVVIDSVVVVPIPCYHVPPNSDGKIIVYAHGGTGPLEYSINNGSSYQDSNVFYPIGMQIPPYIIRVRDSLYCVSDTVHARMTQQPRLYLVTNTPSSIACFGDSTGAICLETWGGTPPYAISISQATLPPPVHPQNPILDTLTSSNFGDPVCYLTHAGVYNVLVTDNNTCQVVQNSVQIFESPEITYDSIIAISPGPPVSYCITIIPHGGVPPYTHHWQTGESTSMICNLVPGNYCDTITDALGCKKVACITIVPLSLITTHNNVCYGATNGWACVQAVGGCPNLQFHWTSISAPPLAVDTLPCINNVPAGIYGICVTDGCGDTECDTITILENSEILATFTVNTVSCGGYNDGSITVNVSGGTPFANSPLYNYIWSTGDTTNTISGLIAGPYSVTVTDSIGCDQLFNVVMPEPPPMQISFSTWSDCATYSALAIVAGGSPPYSYSWSPGGQTLNPATGLSPGTYTLTVTDANNCTDTASVTITALSVTTTSQNVLCHGICTGTATATPVGGNQPFVIEWRDWNNVVIPGNPITDLCSGSYTVTVTDSNSCSVQQTVTINEPANPLIIASLTIPLPMLDCNGDCFGSATAVAGGGIMPYSYLWEHIAPPPLYTVGTGQSISGLCAGTYKLTITDANNCAVDTTFIIDQPAPILITGHTTQHINCFDDGNIGQINITSVTGGQVPYRYSINCPTGFYGFSPNFTGLAPGIYSLGIEDNKGCKSTCIPDTINRPAQLFINFGPVLNPSGNGLCNGFITSTVFGGVPPFEHHWYKLPDASTMLFTEVSTINSTFDSLCAGTYCDSIVDAHGCYKKECITLFEPSALIVQVDSSNISCYGLLDGWIQLTVAGGVPPYTVNFNGVSTILSTFPYTYLVDSLGANSYTFVVVDNNLNTTIRTVTITEPGPLNVSFQTEIVCFGLTNGWIQATVIAGTPPYSHHWNNGMTTDSIFSLAPNQWYIDSVSDSRGCMLNDSLYLAENPQMFVQINNADPTICRGSSIQMNVDANGGFYPYGYLWTPGTGVIDTTDLEPLITPLNNTTYRITVTDLNGCTITDSIQISIDSVPVADFTFSNPCLSRNVNFTNASLPNTTSITGYYWDFGDGNQSTQINPVHTYAANAVYNVTLIITSNLGCTDTVMKTVSVNPVIQIDFTSDTVCLGTNTTLIATSLNPLATVAGWSWRFDSDPPINLPAIQTTIQYQFPYSGIHSVVLAMTDITGCTDSITKPVYVLPSPVITSALTLDTCSGVTLNYTPASSILNTSYLWTSSHGGSCSGNSNNTTNPLSSIPDTLTNSGPDICTVVYHLTPIGPGPDSCAGTLTNLYVNVMPVISVSTNSASQTVLSGQPSVDAIFISTTTVANYHWKYFNSIGSITYTYSEGWTDTIPHQILTLNGGAPATGTLTYVVTGYLPLPGGDTCWGIPFYYNIYVNLEPTAYDLICPGPICDEDTTSIALQNSETGVNYQLYWGNNALQAPQAGTNGDTLTWNGITQAGNYYVIATNLGNLQTSPMNDTCSVTVNPLPDIFALTALFADTCGPVTLQLSGWQSGIAYHLIKDGDENNPVQIQYGVTTPFLYFNPVSDSGMYTVIAVDTATSCKRKMLGNAHVYDIIQQFGIYPGGTLCEGQPVCLYHSEPGINYQLWLGNTPIPPVVPGDSIGGPVCFGDQFVAGTYRVKAINPLTGCWIYFDSTIVIHPLPSVFVMSPGDGCAGDTITLLGCQPGIAYYLYYIPNKANTSKYPWVAGPLYCAGSNINFGPWNDEGIYSVLAVDTVTHCESWMSDSTVIHPVPTAFEIVPQGPACSPQHVTLNDFQAGVIYHLYRDGIEVASDDGADGSVDFGVHTIPGTYKAKGQWVFNGGVCWNDMEDSLVICPTPVKYNLLPLGPLCPPVTFILNGSETGVNYTLWNDVSGPGQIVSGDGDSIVFLPVNQSANYWVVAKYQDACGCSSIMYDTLGVHPGPEKYDVTPPGLGLCELAPVGLSWSQTNTVYELMEVAGIGLVPPVDTILSVAGPFSFLPLQPAGLYVVKATNSYGCAAMMNDTAIVNPLPIVDAGPPSDTICNPPASFISLTGFASIYAGVHWSSPTNPSGSNFSSPDSLSTNYTFNFNDIGNQQVTLTLTAYGTGMCTGFEVSDSISVYLLAPVVNAGADDTTCMNQPVQLSGSITGGASSGIWSTSGTGSFNNPALLNAIYTPSAADITSGLVTLTLTSNNSIYCTDRSDDMILHISRQALVDAGLDDTICETAGSYALLGASGQYATSYYWTTSGTGTFSNATLLNPVYTPSLTDINAGSVTLTITAYSGSPCADVMDAMALHISRQAVVNAGAEDTICETTVNYSIGGASGQYGTSYLWTSSGTGTFSNNSILNPVYTPGPEDINSGFVTLTLSALSAIPCSSVTDAMVLRISRQATVTAGADDTICGTSTYPLLGAASQYATSYNWTSSGSGNFNNPNILNPIYSPSAADIALGYVTLTISVTSNAPCPSVSDAMTLRFNQQASAYAGPDDAICETETYALSQATASNATSYLWTTSGTGNFNNSAVLNPIYTPSATDVNNVCVTLTLHVTSNSGCLSASDDLVLCFKRQAVVYAGPDDALCETGTYLLSAAIAQHSTSIQWTTSGTGSFSNPNIANPVYTPSPADISNGFAILTISATSAPPCLDVSDNMILIIRQQATSYAGPDSTICETETYALSSAMATNGISYQWTTSGTGTFSNPAILNPVYTPSPWDISAGCVTLTLAVTSVAPCDSVSDDMILCFRRQAVVNAGPDDALCETATYLLSGATASYATSYQWTTTGSGTFSCDTILNPIYTPSLADINAGFAVLTLSGTSDAPCNSATDAMLLLIKRQATANAGPDTTICETGTYTLAEATALHAASYTWTTTGTGTFSSISILNPVYTPSPGDISAGCISLILKVTSDAPCDSVSDAMVLCFKRQAIVSAGLDAALCEGGTYILNGATGQYASSYQWTTSGSGTFSDPTVINPVYTPSLADNITGYVTLTISGNSYSPCVTVSDAMLLIISHQTIVNAGQDSLICENEILNLSGATATNANWYHWATSGTGTFSDTTILNPVYTPGIADLSAGCVMLTITAGSNAPCFSATDAMVLCFSRQAIVDAGADDTICESTAYSLSATTSVYAVSYQWTSSGTGTFNNANILNPIYTPSASDVSAGFVTLTVQANSSSPCPDATDSMILRLYYQSTVSAGVNDTVCETAAYSLSTATSMYSTSYQWTSSGTGTFNNANILNPIYTPTVSDVNAGFVTLTIHATSASPCTDATDAMVLYFSRQAIVDAGSDDTICESTAYSLSAATSVYAASFQWTSSGTGTFNNANILNPIYTPSASDVSAGFVTLTVQANSSSPCPGATDLMVLHLFRQATVSAGVNDTVCETAAYSLSTATSMHSTSYQWTSSGTGTFNNANILNPIYTSTVSDVNAGFVTLTIHATSASPCTDATDAMVLYFSRQAIVDAGSDDTICESTAYSLSAATSVYAASYQWTSSGTGTFNNANILNPIYTPSASDVSAGFVTLTVQANSSSPCPGATDLMVLHLFRQATVSAGVNDTVCETAAYSLSTATSMHSTSYQWTSSGTGTFNNANILNPIYTPTVSDVNAGFVTLTIHATSASPCTDATDAMVLYFSRQAIVDAGSDDTICESTAYSLSAATSVYAASYQWTSSGTGTFNNANILNPIYTPSASDVSAGFVTLTVQANSSSPCPGATDLMVLHLFRQATVSAGVNDTVCETAAYSLSTATSMYSTSYQWTSSGTGTFNNANILNPIYTPTVSDVNAGFVTLTILATSASPCPDATDDMVLIINQLAYVNAGPDTTICETDSYALSGASAQNASSFLWTTSGTGTFNDPNLLNPVYTPSVTDISIGFVTLSLTAASFTPCGSSTDEMVLLFIHKAIISAGPDATICEYDSYILSEANATYANSYFWTTSGSGTFSDPNLLNPIYTPSTSDITAGSVILTVTVTSDTPCTNESDFMLLFFTRQAIVNAGPDTTICETDTYTLGYATASYATAYQWTTSGSGSFSDPGILNPVYTPGPGDIASGSVTLNLTGTSDLPCANTTDAMVLFFKHQSVANAGPDDVVCETGSYTLGGAFAPYATSFHWTTSGTGTFSNDSILNPAYTPGASDIAAGMVTLTLTVTSDSPCVNTSDDMVLLINHQASVNAGTDATICASGTYVLITASTHYATSTLWTTSGSGSFSPSANIVNPEYMPSAADIASGSVTLTLSAASTAPCITVTDAMVLTIKPLPVAYAGIPKTACVSHPVHLSDADTNNCNPTSIVWTITSGSGTLNSNFILHPVYTPSNNDAGNIVTLTLTIHGLDECSSETSASSVNLTIEPLPIVDAGPDLTGCVDPIPITGASASNTSFLFWHFTNGTGSLSNPNTISPTYTPAAGDFGHVVTLTLTAFGLGDCSLEQAVSSMNISIGFAPIANAGPGDTICENSTTTLHGSASYASSVLWTVIPPGSGVFSNPTDTITIFTPGDVSIPTTMTLKLTAYGSGSCVNESSESFVDVLVLPASTASAGPDQSICGMQPYTLVAASASNATDIMWTTSSSSGSFVNPYIVNATYYPSAADMAAGFVVLTLSASHPPYCDVASDDMILNLNQIPIAAFAVNTNSSSQPCSNHPVFFDDLSVTNNNSITTWTWNFGDGTPVVTITSPYNPDVWHTFAGNASFYQVTLTVSTSNSPDCSATSTQVVHVYPTPIPNFTTSAILCDHQDVQFFDQTQPNGGGTYTRNWDFGDPGTGINNNSSAQNPVHQFSHSGSFTVTLTVTNLFGCDSTIQHTININERPVSNFNADSVCFGSSTTFTYIPGGSGIITNYYWEFGDGTIATATVPSYSHTYAAAGVYTVTLTVTNSAGCSKDTTKQVLVLGKPLPNFNTSDILCTSDSVYFFDLSSTPHGYIVRWTWDFGDGTPSISRYFPDNPNITHLYALPGTFNVTLTIHTSDSCSEQKIKPVVIQPAPIANFEVNQNSPACELLPVSFTDLSVPNGGSQFSWSWDFGDPLTGTANYSTLQNPEHSFSHNGTFNVLLLVTNANGCYDTITKAVVIADSPFADFEANSVCYDSLTYFTDQSVTNTGSITGWLWEFGDPASGTNNTSLLQNPTHLFTNWGSFEVKLTVTNSNGCVHDTTISIDVHPAPEALFKTNKTKNCLNEIIHFLDLSTLPEGQIHQWSWDFDVTGTSSNDTSTLQNPSWTYSYPGTYKVKLRVTTSSGCSDSIVQDVQIFNPPKANFRYSTTPCSNGAVYFQDSSYAYQTTIVSWNWEFEPYQFSTQQNPVYTYYKTDTCYNIRLIVTDFNTCSDTTDTNKLVCVPSILKVAVNASKACYGDSTWFNPQILSPDSQIFHDSLVFFNWNFGDPTSGIYNTSTLRNPLHYYSHPGTYTVILQATDIHNCTALANSFVVVKTLPDPTFSYSISNCDSTIRFYETSSGSGSNIVRWTWDYGDGTDTTVYAPDDPDRWHHYASPGTYHVSLTIVNADSCTNTKTQVVYVAPCMQAVFVPSADTICQNYTITLIDSSSSGIPIGTWRWKFGDGDSLVYHSYRKSITHSYISPGTYTVQLQIISIEIDGKTVSDSVSYILFVKPGPSAMFTANDVCIGNPVSFSNSSTINGMSAVYKWHFNDPNNSSGDTSSLYRPHDYLYSKPGLYNVYLFVTNNLGCNDTIMDTVIVHPSPKPDFEVKNACLDKLTEIKNMTPEDYSLMDSISWTFNSDILIESSERDPHIVFPEPGDYNVNLFVADQNGCWDTISRTMTINRGPTSAFSYTEIFNDNELSLSLNNESTGLPMDTLSYRWYFINDNKNYPLGQSTNKDASFILPDYYGFDNDGFYTLMLVTKNKFGCMDTLTKPYFYKGLFIPTAFAPESFNPELNLFQPQGLGLKTFKIEVFDKWGNRLWLSEELQNAAKTIGIGDEYSRPGPGWDGKFNDEYVPIGVYVWKVTAKFLDGSVWNGQNAGEDKNLSGTVYGTVTIIR